METNDRQETGTIESTARIRPRPSLVSASYTAWMIALAAGVFETLLVVAQVALTSDGPGAGSVAANVLVRAAVFAGLLLLARAMRSGRRTPRTALLLIFGIFGTGSLIIDPVGFLMDGGSIASAMGDASGWEIVFACSRLVHVAAVWSGAAFMFHRSTTQYFQRREATTVKTEPS